ncbi:MAG: pilus assembly FimT family protein [Planctomycetota bacterium]|jgi:type II secretory pathway pseudopilin PulG
MNNRRSSSAGFVLVEMLMVVGLIALMTGVAMLSFGSMWGNLRFKRQAEELVNVFQMAYNASVETSRRYAVILDFAGQGFVLREYKSLDLAAMDPEEAILQTGYFSKDLTIDYVVYDDLDDTRDWDNVSEARFLAGQAGWQYGGIVILLDDDGMPWTLVIHRFARPVELFEGEWNLDSLGMLPQDKENVPF